VAAVYHALPGGRMVGGPEKRENRGGAQHRAVTAKIGKGEPEEQGIMVKKKTHSSAVW